jgi:hypothetical protein
MCGAKHKLDIRPGSGRENFKIGARCRKKFGSGLTTLLKYIRVSRFLVRTYYRYRYVFVHSRVFFTSLNSENIQAGSCVKLLTINA